MEKLVQKLDDHERRLGALEGEYIEDDAQIEQYTQHEAPFSLMVEATNAPATDFRAITDISLAGYCEVVEELAVVDSQVDWQAGTVPSVASATKVVGSVTLRPHLTFDGVDDHARVVMTPVATGAITLEVRLRSTNTREQMFLGGPSLLYFRILTGGKLHFSVQTSAGQRSITGTASLQVGTEYWVHASYDGVTLRTYLNKAPDAGFVVSAPLNPWQLQRIGRWTDTDPRSFVGDIFEVRAWNRVLSLDELGQPLTGTESGLVALWRCEEGEGTILTDSSPNGYVATLQGGPIWTYPTAATITTMDLDLGAGALPDRPVLIYPVGPDQPAGTAVTVTRYRMRADQADLWGDWEAATADGLTQQPPLRYMQVELQLSTTDTTVTPQVDRLGIYD